MEDQNNPFASPLATNQPVVDPNSPDYMQPLAGRGTRLGAAIIDGIIMFVVFGGPYLWVLTRMYPAIWSPESVVTPGMTPAEAQTAIAQATQPSMAVQLVASLVGILVFIAIHGYLLATNGQTVGKRLLGIKIVRSEGGKPEFGRLIGLRYLPMWLASLIPVVGPFVTGFVDPLLIFRSSRKCLHDNIADTIVVNAE